MDTLTVGSDSYNKYQILLCINKHTESNGILLAIYASQSVLTENFGTCHASPWKFVTKGSELSTSEDLSSDKIQIGYIRFFFDENDMEVFVDYLFVDYNYREKGYGTLLLNILQDWCVKRGVRCIKLVPAGEEWVKAFYTKRCFIYKKCGYSKCMFKSLI